MVALAGSAAQRLAGYADSTDGEHSPDFDDAGNCAVMLARVEGGLPTMPGLDEPRELKPGDPLYTAARAIVDRAWTETVTMLRDNWRAVVQVAGAPAKHDRLSQAELDCVIAHGQREQQR